MNNSRNIVMLVGTIGKAVELSYTVKGTMKGDGLLAVDRGYKKEDGTDWFRLRFWGRLAEVAAEYTGKGSRIFIQGHLRGEFYESKQLNGKTLMATEVVVDAMEFLSRPPGEKSQSAAQAPATANGKAK